MTRAGLPAFQVVYQASRMHDLPGYDFRRHTNIRRTTRIGIVGATKVHYQMSPFPTNHHSAIQVTLERWYGCHQLDRLPAIPDYFQQRRGLTTLNVSIKAIGVWETVGSLGVPRIGWLGAASERLSAGLSDYSFYDTMLDDKIQNAFQALALDEKRASFQPCVWEKRDDSETNLVQVWFPGVCYHTPLILSFQAMAEYDNLGPYKCWGWYVSPIACRECSSHANIVPQVTMTKN